MSSLEYLVSHGNAGTIGRFAAEQSLSCEHGDRVIVRTANGLENGVVLCAASAWHAAMLENAEPGELLRLTTPEDDTIAQGVRARAEQLFSDARTLAGALGLPLEILDVEITLDGHRVTLYYLRGGAGDERPLVSTLSKKYEVMVALRDLALPAGASACGKPDCGNQSGAGCTTCASGGGCATGCGSKTLARDVQEYFAGLRQKMEDSHRVPLH